MIDLYVFRPDYPCPRTDCEVSMLEHIRKFVHGSSSLLLIVRRIGTSINESSNNAGDDITTTWGWCRKCKKVAFSFVWLNRKFWSHRYASLPFTCSDVIDGQGYAIIAVAARELQVVVRFTCRCRRQVTLIIRIIRNFNPWWLPLPIDRIFYIYSAPKPLTIMKYIFLMSRYSYEHYNFLVKPIIIMIS